MAKNAILYYRHTGKMISLVIAAVYGLGTYYFMGYMKDLLATNKINVSLIMIFITLVIGLLNAIRDMAIDEFDMQSLANKERAAHEQTKERLISVQNELLAANTLIQEKKDIIHAIQCHINNSFLDSKTDTEALEKVKNIIKKVNANKNVNNTATTIDLDSDYMVAFGI